MMKAIRVHEFGGPEVLRLEEIPVPSPGPGEILLKVEAIGVNPVETYQRGGSNPALPLPWTPGTDCAGIVEDAMPAATVDGLRAMGHAVKVMPEGSLDFGSAQLIARMSEASEDGYAAGSDHRRDGMAVGY